MKRKPKPAVRKGPRGPQPKPIDWQTVAVMAGEFCTQEDIAHALDLSVDTLDNRAPEEIGCKLSEYIKRHMGKGRNSLRSKQYALAMQGDKTMLIWLGKQYLGQSDKIAHEVEIDDVEWVDDGK